MEFLSPAINSSYMFVSAGSCHIYYTYCIYIFYHGLSNLFQLMNQIPFFLEYHVVEIIFNIFIVCAILNLEIFANSFKRHICDGKNSWLEPVLPLSEDDIS